MRCRLVGRRLTGFCLQSGTRLGGVVTHHLLFPGHFFLRMARVWLPFIFIRNALPLSNPSNPITSIYLSVYPYRLKSQGNDSCWLFNIHTM